MRIYQTNPVTFNAYFKMGLNHNVAHTRLMHLIPCNVLVQQVHIHMAC